MEAFLVSIGVVSLAEMGDKTQLLSLVLVARYRKPWPILLGILAATLANHALAAFAGGWIQSLLGPEALRWVLGASFIAMALWMLVPDRLDEGVAEPRRLNVFAATVILFFLAEMGDKTQLATVVLAAKYDALAAVVSGTTIGMLLANAPVLWFGQGILRRVPLKLVHRISALIFAALGIAALMGRV